MPVPCRIAVVVAAFWHPQAVPRFNDYTGWPNGDRTRSRAASGFVPGIDSVRSTINFGKG
jgi:hypothetical protein